MNGKYSGKSDLPLPPPKYAIPCAYTIISMLTYSHKNLNQYVNVLTGGIPE